MSWIKAVLHELLGLFVDDGAFAAAIVAWLLVVWLILPRLGVGPGWSGGMLVAGLVLILLESTARRARR